MIILKILGILLLFLLALLISVLLIPVRYSLRAEYHDKLLAEGAAEWCLRMLRAEFCYRENLKYRIYLFGIPLGRKTDRPVSSGNREPAFDGKTEPPGTVAENSEVEWMEPEPTQPPEKPVEGLEVPKAEMHTTENSSSGEKMTRLLKFFSNEDYQKGFSVVLQGIRKIFRHVGPRQFSGYLAFGTGDPASTGKLLACFAFLYPFTQNAFRFLPDFEKEKLEGTAEWTGRIQLGYVLWTALRVWFHKDFRRLYHGWKCNAGSV